MGEWSGTKVLITGAGGFIGSNLARRFLVEGARVTAVVRPGSEPWRLADILHRLDLVVADVTDHTAVRTSIGNRSPEIVFHLAITYGHPQTSDQRLAQLHTSVLGTFAVIEACLEAGVPRLVHLGSSTEYRAADAPMDESVPLEPRSFRGMAKAQASHLVGYYARALGLPACILRPFSVYGPWEAMDRLIPRLLCAGLTGQEVALTDPGFRHDFVFVDDVVEAAMAAALRELAPGQALNIGTGQDYSNEEVAGLVAELVGRPLKVKLGAHPPSPVDRSHWRADPSAARRLLGWEPRYTLREGLRVHLEWMRDRLGL